MDCFIEKFSTVNFPEGSYITLTKNIRGKDEYTVFAPTWPGPVAVHADPLVAIEKAIKQLDKIKE